jgi:hypothetical protein
MSREIAKLERAIALEVGTNAIVHPIKLNPPLASAFLPASRRRVFLLREYAKI